MTMSQARSPSVGADRRPQGPAGAAGTEPPGRRPPRLSGRSAYSVFVGAMKVFLPAVAVGLIVMIAIWPQLEESSTLRLDFVERLVEAPKADESLMIAPRYQGIDENRQPFMVTADQARQVDPDGDELVEMENPAADLFDGDGRWVAITADHGVYQPQQEVLLLDGNVNVYQEEGYELITAQAVVDLVTDVATSSTPTRGQATFGTVRSEGMRIEERGARVYFTGKAHMTIYPDETGSATQTSASGSGTQAAPATETPAAAVPSAVPSAVPGTGAPVPEAPRAVLPETPE
jgi:lipopolysaccharide export system protein LptC